MTLAHCTTTFGGHSLLCDRDGQFCSLESTHAGPCQPHGRSYRICSDCKKHVAEADIIMLSVWKWNEGEEVSYRADVLLCGKCADRRIAAELAEEGEPA